ncbi:MAG: hypothetical protein O7B81_13435 [Gammaproteobacteria bacterium]|nr:hypothetical protein [Gammaproteobacteria bacterium]
MTGKEKRGAFYYAAHNEGEFASELAALMHVGLSVEQANAALNRASASDNSSPVVRLNDEYGAVVTERDGRFILWRAFYGEEFSGSEEQALGAIRTFQEQGVEGEWALFSYDPPQTTARH